MMPAAAIPLLAACGGNGHLTVENPSAFSRNELAEFPLPETRPFRILRPDSTEIPYQITSDSTVLFEVQLAPGEIAEYLISKGIPSEKADTATACGLHPERYDDFAWENDRAAYRAYGPALQAKGERAYGYDVWTKKVPYPVLGKRYHNNVVLKIPYHDDLGDGMDVYSVGQSLGGGATAILDREGTLVYPWAFAKAEILDNGPLRVKFRLTYPPVEVDGDTITEIRTITLDKGSFLNRAVVEYRGLSSPVNIAAGIVVHRQNPAGFRIDSGNKTISYTELTDNPANDNGIMYLGLIAPGAGSFTFRTASEPALHRMGDCRTGIPEEAIPGDAVGHVLALATIRPGDRFTYYWGSGWSKGYMPDSATWAKTLERAAETSASPLIISHD